jgi:hypothetical protein
VMSSRRRLEAKHVGTSSKLAKPHTDARLVVRTIPAYSAVVATTLRITLGIWCTLVYPWAIVAVVTAETLRHGDFQYIARYIHRMKKDHKARTRERRQLSPTNWSRLYE